MERQLHDVAPLPKTVCGCKEYSKIVDGQYPLFSLTSAVVSLSKFPYVQTLRYSHDAMDRAAKRGLIDMLQFLWKQGQTCTTVRRTSDGDQHISVDP